jgi:hypothetical protein
MAGENTGQLYTPQHHEGRLDQRLNSTNYIHPQETNLLNLHKAMEYDLGGKPIIRVVSKMTGTEVAGQVSSFGEPLAISPTPVIQLDAIYGTTTDVIQTYTNGTGSSAGSVNQIFKVQSGTTQGGYGVLRSKRFIRYRPGQGVCARFTAAFTTGVVGSLQFVGLANQENRVAFGYDGDKFGICRSTGGKATIYLMTMTVAPNATQTATINLNGVAYTVTLGNTSAEVAIQTIANRVGGYGGWLFQQVDGAMLWLAPTLGPMVGTFSFTSTGNAQATFSLKQQGVAQTDYWTYQEDWNVDRLNGTGDIRNASAMDLDHTKLNVFQIGMRWLGVGVISYAVEDQNSGTLIYVHREHYTNQHVVPHVDNPSFKITYAAYNLTNTTNLAVIGGSIYGAIEGTIFLNELTRSHHTSKSSLAQNTAHHIMTIKNAVVTNGLAGANNGNYVINAKEAIVKQLSVSVQGTDPVNVYLLFDATSFSSSHLYNNINYCNEVYSTATGNFNITTDTPIWSGICGINGTINIDLSSYRITIPPGSQLSIVAQSTNQITRIDSALTWSED